MDIPSLSSNWVDLVIIIIILLFFTRAVRFGFFVVLVDFVSFLASLLISLRVYQSLAILLRRHFSLSHSVSNALGFLLSAIIIESILGLILFRLVVVIPRRLRDNLTSKIFAIIPAIGEGLVLVAFLLTLALAFPISPKVKVDITESKIGSYLVDRTSVIESKINEVFGGVIEDSLTYLTVKPESLEIIELRVEKQELKVDENAEIEMFVFVNEERKKVGVSELIWSLDLLPVARAHAQDMWERRYFGHISPEGEDVGKRLIKAGINFFAAGENLALAPTVVTAHTGLMNSPGHRENILSNDFGKVGIGVIDNGVYGKIFVQVFAD